MKFTATLFTLTVAAILVCLSVPATMGQDQDEDVRGAFMTTRPKSSDRTPKANVSAKPVRRRPKPVSPDPNTPANPDDSTTGTTKTKDNQPKVRSQKIGLGMTLFMRDSSGLAVRVDPTREFRKGDRVRLLVETNADGYIYIFNTTDGGQPVLIYPDPELDEGGNYVQAHVPFDIPASGAAEERLRWLTFDEHAGAEKVYVVFTREPLPGVPIEDELLKFCKQKTSNCPVRPESGLWSKIQQEKTTPVGVAKAKSFGKVETPNEQRATTRGIGLSKGDPEPSLIMMTTSTNPSMLVATIDLIHK